MGEKLTVKEAAKLKNCSQRYIQSLIKSKKLKAHISDVPSNNKKQYLINLDDLPFDLRAKYYKQLNKNLVYKVSEQKGDCEVQRYEDFTAKQRKELDLWAKIIEFWQKHREIFDSKAKADEQIIGAINLKLKKEGSDLVVSQSMLYRKYSYYKKGDFKSVIGKSGGHNKGKSSIPSEVWDGFLSFYLDDTRPTFRDCYNTTVDWTREFYPQFIEDIPSEMTFRRKLKEAVPKAVIKYMRQGEKVLKDECLPYIERLYDDLKINDVWVTDTHTLDVHTQYLYEDETGKEKTGIHRPSITVFFEARSGIITGWNVTDNPSINSSIFALRQGIMRTGTVPKIIYADNGSEFMSYDYGGRVNRSKTAQKELDYAMTILGRLGIQIKAAQVKNARAKPIERFFLDFKNHISKMFDTYTGGNITERPEGLKKRLKDGKIPIDSELRLIVDEMIELENQGMYGGNEKRFEGLTKQEVYNLLVKDSVRVAIKEDELNLMLMRSMTVQKVKRKGVKVRIAGEDIWYSSEDTWMHLDKEVFVRYNPLDLSTARIYDKQDRYLFTWQVDKELMLAFIEIDKQRLADANEKLARDIKAVKNYAKGLTNNLSPETKIDMLDLKLRKLHKLRAEGKLVLEQSGIVSIRRAKENTQTVSAMENELKQTGTDSAVIIDINRMNKNLEKNKS